MGIYRVERTINKSWHTSCYIVRCVKIDLSIETRKKLEEFFTALIEYQLEGRLMIFQGLCSHLEMVGALNIMHSIVGWERGLELIREVTERPTRENWKDNKGWKFKGLNEAYSELTKVTHTCTYCNKIDDNNSSFLRLLNLGASVVYNLPTDIPQLSPAASYIANLRSEIEKYK